VENLTFCDGRSNFLGTKFTIYDAQPPHSEAKFTRCRSTRIVNLRQVSPKFAAGNCPIAHISYELNVLGSRYDRYSKLLPYLQRNMKNNVELA